MRKTQLTMVVVACGLIAGCANSDRTSNRNIGAFIGAGSGGIIGAQFGAGTGNIIAIAAGVVGGALLGDQVGSYLDASDRARVNQARQLAFDDGKKRAAKIWNNPRTGHSGLVTPLDSYQAASGEQCRRYRHEVVITGHKKVETGAACRQADGAWRVVG